MGQTVDQGAIDYLCPTEIISWRSSSRLATEGSEKINALGCCLEPSLGFSLAYGSSHGSPVTSSPRSSSTLLMSLAALQSQTSQLALASKKFLPSTQRRFGAGLVNDQPRVCLRQAGNGRGHFDGPLADGRPMKLATWHTFGRCHKRACCGTIPTTHVSTFGG